MKTNSQPVIVLMVDDDSEDIYLTKRAFRDGKFLNDFHSVQSGDELFEYLGNTGKFTDNTTSPRPHIILLDINLPKKNGLEILQELGEDSRYKTIPVVMLTTSSNETDIFDSYGLGANSYITKPVSVNGMLDIVQHFENYWFQLVKIPNREQI